MNKFTYIQTQEELNKAAEEWKREEELAIDLECENNLHHYGAYVALFQISSRKNNWVVDVLALNDMHPLLDILSSHKILKIFHDVGFDFRIIKEQFACDPKNVFDTQTAALLLGKENLGLGSLLEEYLSIEKDRKFQKMDWTKRPLSAEMLAYAVGDTAYILQLKDLLEADLRKAQRWTWAEEELKHLENNNFQYHEQTYLDISGARSLSPKELGILHVLFEERKKIAEMVDKPVFKVFGNKQLMVFAQNPPRDWSRLRGVHPLIRREAGHFLELVQRAKPEIFPKKITKRMTVKEGLILKDFIEGRNKIAVKLGLRGHLLANQDQMIDLVVNKSVDKLKNWQKEVLGKLLKKFLN
jgi:ribonuclease D